MLSRLSKHRACARANAGAAGVGDSLYPEFGNGGYDAHHYLLDITVKDVTTSALTAVATMEATAIHNLAIFNLDFSGFAIESMTVNGDAAAFRRSGRELVISPAAPLQTGEIFTVAVTYSGVPQQRASVADPMLTGWLILDNGSSIVSEPDGAAKFFPVNDHPLDKATYTFRVTVPHPFEVAANGLLVESLDHGDSTTFVWQARDPLASYLATVNIGDFDIEVAEGPNGLLLRNYYEVGVEEDIRNLFSRQAEMLAFYRQAFRPLSL